MEPWNHRPRRAAGPRLARRALGACLAVGLAAGLLGAPAAGAAQATDLRPGAPETIALDGEPVVRRIVVPDDVTGLRISTSDSDGDVELYLSFDDEPEPYAGYFDVAADNIWLEESLFIEASDRVPLQAGAWYVAVVPGADGPTTTTLAAEFVRPALHSAKSGEVFSFELTREHGLRARVEVELPLELATQASESDIDEASPEPAGRRRRDKRTAPKVHWLVEIDCPIADVDVSVQPIGMFSDLEETYAWGEDLHGYERLHVDVPRFRRKVLIEVYAYHSMEHAQRLPVRLLMQRDEPPNHAPALDLCPAPRIPGNDFQLAIAPFDAAARATVVLVGRIGAGSGVVVSPDGYILSCAHVLVGAERVNGRPSIAVGFTLDPAVPPVPSLGAELVAVRQDLDLALVRITGDLLGRPLAPLAGVARRFPHITPSTHRPLLGEPVFGFGYPMTGGSASMVSLTMTSGVCAGYAREVEGVLLKTDAEVHSGDSGGPFVDGLGRYLGVATSSLADVEKGGGIGYVVPLELIPEEWRARIGW